MERQSHWSPELIRSTPCCSSWAGVRNGKVWCAACGQHLVRLSEALTILQKPSEPPATIPASFGPQKRSRGVSEAQGSLL